MGSTARAGNNGAFLFKSPADGTQLTVLASDQADWDHVSVSANGRCPTWGEMVWVRDIFFRGDEWIIQYGPPKGLNINCHEYCLHWWRPQKRGFPVPDRILV